MGELSAGNMPRKFGQKYIYSIFYMGKILFTQPIVIATIETISSYIQSEEQISHDEATYKAKLDFHIDAIRAE
ncbi:hypothetical protein N7490_004352 [Penicillium lividum]|nr:hypothetical protein N7490_004352 [Penicillium lividum]